jgi:4-diphosphocytidyl-2-C-methyl-D-erythritol kinase
MSTLTCKASAKLNLTLRVNRRRDDGFHEIDTLMVKLPGLADTLEFAEAAELGLQCDDASLPVGADNLVLKAALAYAEAAGVACRYAISLKKAIPHGAGLGGGSSDAAATLMALDQLHGGRLGAAKLHELAAALGSDVPFFMQPGAARCTGRGEILDPVKAPPALRVLLLKPAFAVATPDAYRRWQDSRELPALAYGSQSIDGLEIVNDLERPVFEKHRFLAELKQWLLTRDECAAALLAGSGATVFAVLREGADAKELARAARHELDPRLWVWAGETGA